MYENEIFDENTIQSVEKFIKNEPYCSQRFMYSMLNYCNLQDDDIKFLINTWKKIKIERPYDIENVRKRSDVMLEIAKKTTNVNLKNDIAEIIKLEYKKYSKIFLDNVRNRQTDLISRYEFGYYTEDFREAVSILDSGWSGY